MSTRSLLALAVGCPLFSGCVQGPPLQYSAFSDGAGALQGDYIGLTKFTLARSLVLIQANRGQPALVESIPAEAVGEGTDFGVRQRGTSSANALQVTKVGNSDLVSSLSLGSALGRDGPTPLPIASSMASLTPPPGLAVAIDVQALLTPAQPGANTVTGVTQGAGGELAYSVTFAPVGADAIATNALDLNRTGGLYFYSACRQATLRFLNAPLAGQAYTLMVADPHFVQTVAVAPGRTITSHSACGVDVLAGPASANSGNDDARAQRVEFARSLNARWATRVLPDTAAALAALKSHTSAKPTRRKGKPAVAAAETLPATAPVQLPTLPANSPLRNAEIRIPAPRPGESFAF